jgi:hypothetical protein
MRRSLNRVQVQHAAVRLAIVAGCTVALSACASIPQRAWRNGEAMSSSRAFNSVMNGNTSIQAHRALQQSLDPLRLNYREVAYPAFGQWWY